MSKARNNFLSSKNQYHYSTNEILEAKVIIEHLRILPDRIAAIFGIFELAKLKKWVGFPFNEAIGLIFDDVEKGIESLRRKIFHLRHNSRRYHFQSFGYDKWTIFRNLPQGSFFIFKITKTLLSLWNHLYFLLKNIFIVP